MKLDNVNTNVQFARDIDMDTNSILNLGAPTNDNDAARKKYVDDGL